MFGLLSTFLVAAVVAASPSIHIAPSSATPSTLRARIAAPPPWGARRMQSNAGVNVLSEDFSQDGVGGPAAGWNVLSGTWSVCQGDSGHAYCQTSANTGQSMGGASWWGDYTVDALVNDPNVSYGGAGIVGRAMGPSLFYLFELRSQISGSAPYWYLLKKGLGTSTIMAGGPLNAPDANPNYRLRLAFSGSTITASIAFDGGTNYQVVASGSDSSYATGQIGAFTWGSAGKRFTNVNVALTGSAPLPSESAISSDAFVDSIGMNAHFESSSYQNYPQVRSFVGNLGVRHYRVSASHILAQGTYLSELTDLYASYGTKFDVLVSRLNSQAQIAKALALLPPGSIDSVEGPNETDSQSQGAEYDPNFAIDVPAFMSSLYSTLKSTPATAQIPIIGPSFANWTSYAAIGNISAYVDAGNMHDYFAGFNPGTIGWGGNGFTFGPSFYYGSIDWNVADAGQATGAKPVVATETGYYTAAVHGGVPLDVQSKYVPRLFFEQYRHHVPRTFLYQLIGYGTTTGDASLDIISPASVPSPAYGTLLGMLSLLGEGGRQTSPMNYNWGLTGQTSNVDHLLLHKVDGTMVLPLWIEAPSFDPNANGGAGAKIAVARQTVTVTIAQPANTGVLWTYDPTSGIWSWRALAVVNGSVSFDIGDSVSILEIGPSAQPASSKRRTLR